MTEAPTNEHLAKMAALVKERFISRMRRLYGETDEFEQWADSMDTLDRYPTDPAARQFSRDLLTQLIRTKHPDWKP